MNILYRKIGFRSDIDKREERERASKWLFSDIASRSLAESQLAITLLELSTMFKTFQSASVVSETRFSI